MAFSKGDTPIETLIDRLRRSEVNPMTDEFLILNVAQANMRERGPSKHHKHTVRYYTFDHRRFWFMHQAGCTAVRVRVTRSGRERDELFNKADWLGRPIAKLEVRKGTGLVASAQLILNVAHLRLHLRLRLRLQRDRDAKDCIRVVENYVEIPPISLRSR